MLLQIKCGDMLRLPMQAENLEQTVIATFLEDEGQDVALPRWKPKGMVFAQIALRNVIYSTEVTVQPCGGSCRKRSRYRCPQNGDLSTAPRTFYLHPPAPLSAALSDTKFASPIGRTSLLATACWSTIDTYYLQSRAKIGWIFGGGGTW